MIARARMCAYFSWLVPVNMLPGSNLMANVQGSSPCLTHANSSSIIAFILTYLKLRIPL